MFTEIANYLYNNKGHSYFDPEDIFILFAQWYISFAQRCIDCSAILGKI